MKKLMSQLAVALLLASLSFAATDVVTAVHGTVSKIDSGTKMIVVKTANGAEDTMHFVAETAVDGTDVTAELAKAGDILHTTHTVESTVRAAVREQHAEGVSR